MTTTKKSAYVQDQVEKKPPLLDETREDVREWRAALKELNDAQRTLFTLEKKLPTNFGAIGDDTSPSRLAFNAALLVGEAWRELLKVGEEKAVPHQWEALPAYAPSERALDVRLDCQPERREAATA